MQKSREKIKQFNWEVILKGLENSLKISDSEKKRIFRERMDEVKNSFEYYDEEKITSRVDELLKEIGVQEENEKEKFSKEIKNKLKEYFRKSPEKKGINFRDKIEDPQEVKAWLYLVLPKEQREQFKDDFQKVSTSNEAFYFRLWPPSIGNVFRYFIGKEKPVGYKSSEFLKDFEGYIEDIQQGKNRITLAFDEDKLPENLKNKPKEELEQLGIHKINGEYEIYITPEKISEMLNLNLEQILPAELLKHQIAKELGEIQQLLKECKFIAKLPEGEGLYNTLLTSFNVLTLRFRDLMERGATKEELENLQKNIRLLKDALIEFAKGKEEKDKNKVIRNIKNWLKDKGPLILSSIGLWGLALFWFLPLWIITKMYDEIEKSGMVKVK